MISDVIKQEGFVCFAVHSRRGFHAPRGSQGVCATRSIGPLPLPASQHWVGSEHHQGRGGVVGHMISSSFLGEAVMVGGWLLF